MEASFFHQYTTCKADCKEKSGKDRIFVSPGETASDRRSPASGRAAPCVAWLKQTFHLLNGYGNSFFTWLAHPVPANAQFPIEETLFGILISFKELQPENALSPMRVRPSGSWTLRREEHS